MSRSLQRKCSWLFLSILTLTALTSAARGQSSVNVTVTASALSPQWVPAPSDPSNPATAALSASVSNPPVPPYNCTLYGPQWAWNATGGDSVLYSVDNVNWTQAAADSYSTWIVQSEQWAPTATLQVLYGIGGYWQFPCSATANYNDAGCGDTWNGTGTTLIFGTSVQLINLTVISGATQENMIGATNWATVQTYAGDKVITQATTLPNTPDAWAQILWTGGDAVPGQANQRSVDKGTSAMVIVSPNIGLQSLLITVWVIWATINNQVTGMTPKNAVQFGTRYDGTEKLGAQTWNNGNVANGKVVPIATVTPAGVNAAITGGFVFKRNTWRHTFVDGAKGPFYDATWQPDNTAESYTVQAPHAADGTTLALDTNDNCYDRDAPGIRGAANVDSVEIYANFQEYLQWNGQTCSAYAGWYFQARWKANACGTNQVVTPFTQVAQGALDLSKYTTAFYKPPGCGGCTPPCECGLITECP